MQADIVSMPGPAFMSVGLTGGNQFASYIQQYNSQLSSTSEGRMLIERTSKVFDHVLGNSAIASAKAILSRTTSKSTDDNIYSLQPGMYETANNTMIDIVMCQPEMVAKYKDNTINAYEQYEYKLNSAQLDDMYYSVMANEASSDDYDDYIYISESSDPDGYEPYTCTERDIIRDVWRDIHISLDDDIDPVTGESI